MAGKIDPLSRRYVKYDLAIKTLIKQMFAMFEIPQTFIVENSKQGINFNTGYVTNVTF